MKTRQSIGAAVGVAGLLMVVASAAPPFHNPPVAQEAEIQAWATPQTSYALLGDGLFAQGCMGSGAGKHGCMCPMQAASEFTGAFTLTRNHHAPQGHQVYDMALQDWRFTFDGEEREISGTGYYNRWTDLQGHRWHAMTLDLIIYDEEVCLLSGVHADPDPSYDPPATINLGLESDTVCFGYLVVVSAGRVPVRSLTRGSIPPLGGPCEYIDTPGTATIVSVEPADPDALNCPNDPVVVMFDFQPVEPAGGTLAATGIRLTISEGVNPPREWVESEGLTPGSQHPCLRRDITSGACTPLLFELTDVDYGTGIDLCYADTTFAMTVVPAEIFDAIYEQQIVLLVAIENYGCQPVAEPVCITAIAPGADITIEPASILPGQVCEVTVVPHERQTDPAASMSAPRIPSRPGGYPEGEELIVQITGERNGFEQVQDVSINILPGEDWLLEEAVLVRDRFIPYLAQNHPEFGITEGTQWTGTIVKPHILVVSHYLFFSDDWEMGVMWHIMIPPYDWAKVYLRHRYTNMQPQYAFEISSLSAVPPEPPHPIAPPEQVDR